MIHVARKGSKFLMVSTLTNPFSRGSVHITSAYLRNPPEINPNMIHTPSISKFVA